MPTVPELFEITTQIFPYFELCISFEKKRASLEIRWIIGYNTMSAFHFRDCPAGKFTLPPLRASSDAYCID